MRAIGVLKTVLPHLNGIERWNFLIRNCSYKGLIWEKSEVTNIKTNIRIVIIHLIHLVLFGNSS